MENEQTFFDFAAYVGLTKHLGNVKATQELIKLCRIGLDSVVLDVGCGVGVTACFLAKMVGCRVVGVDINPAMVQRAQERAERERVSDRAEFRVADAQDLPFEDARFDAVITESVTAFPEDKQKAICEYARVAKPGGYVGLNESTWLKSPPLPEMLEWASQELGSGARFLTFDQWTEMVAQAGLEQIEAKTCAIDIRQEGKGIVQRYGLWSLLGSTGRALRLYLRNPAYRKFLKSVRQQGVVPENITDYFGYGIYVGYKPS